MTILEQLHEHKQDIIKMYETMSMKDIAIKYNVHIQDISNFLKINNIPKKKRISTIFFNSFFYHFFRL